MASQSNVRPRVLLVNPPIYDFTAYDFWLKPYGLLQVGGFLRGRASVSLFDYLDRLHPAMADGGRPLKTDRWERGPYRAEPAPKPAALADIPRRYHRFGLPRRLFADRLAALGPLDAVLIQTVMTYWYPGVREVIEDVRRCAPGARIVLGGPYAALCPEHARSLGADRIVRGADLAPLRDLLGLDLDPEQPPFWEGYGSLRVGVLKASDGCPFRCTYCSVPRLAGGFAPRPPARCARERDLLRSRGVTEIAWYDDAFLCLPEETQEEVLQGANLPGPPANFHAPNGFHAALLTPSAARRLVRAGFRTFFLGLECASEAWHRGAGGKARPDDAAAAAEHLVRAGAPPGAVTAYLLAGHPDSGPQEIEASLRFAHGLGLRAMLSEFAPVPGTPDGERARRVADLSEPLNHNKTAFAIRTLGHDRLQALKALCRDLNRRIRTAKGTAGPPGSESGASAP